MLLIGAFKRSETKADRLRSPASDLLRQCLTMIMTWPDMVAYLLELGLPVSLDVYRSCTVYRSLRL